MLVRDTLYFLLVFSAFFLLYKGANPMFKIIAGHIPVQGLREFLVA